MRRTGAAGLQVVTLLAVLAAGAATLEAQEPKVKRERDRITREEILTSAQSTQDAYQAIRSLRPHFLAPPRGNRSMGSTRPAATKVYVDGTLAGELDVLKSILAVNLEEVRYLDAVRAQEEHGITHSGGALRIKLHKAVPPS
jgi:hypothetical protein